MINEERARLLQYQNANRVISFQLWFRMATPELVLVHFAYTEFVHSTDIFSYMGDQRHSKHEGSSDRITLCLYSWDIRVGSGRGHVE